MRSSAVYGVARQEMHQKVSQDPFRLVASYSDASAIECDYAQNTRIGVRRGRRDFEMTPLGFAKTCDWVARRKLVRMMRCRIECAT